MSNSFDVEQFKANAIEQLKAGVPLSGKDGVLAPLLENLLNSALEGEMDSHLEGREREFGNRRNGHMSKQVQTSMGEVTINTPRDRDGTFDPQVVRKRENILADSLADRIIGLYAIGNSPREISDILEEQFGNRISAETISSITDRVLPEIYNMRRNPVIADVFTQLDYMEKRGSGLRKMRELTEKLPNFLQSKEPQYQTVATSFFTTFYNLNWNENGRIPVEEVANRVNRTLKKHPVNEESSVKIFGDSQKSSVKTFGDSQNPSVKPKRLGRTAQSILDLIISDGSISQDKMAEKIGVSKRAIEMQIAKLKAKGLLVREGADHGGYWRIVINPQTE